MTVKEFFKDMEPGDKFYQIYDNVPYETILTKKKESVFLCRGSDIEFIMYKGSEYVDDNNLFKTLDECFEFILENIIEKFNMININFPSMMKKFISENLHLETVKYLNEILSTVTTKER